MKKYHYATVRSADFCELALVPRHRDAYVSDDATSAAIRALLDTGYRLHSLDPVGQIAIFEREFEALPPKVATALGHPALDPAKVLRDMLDAAEDQHGVGVCDCRPEPENAGHLCCFCQARLLLRLPALPA